VAQAERVATAEQVNPVSSLRVAAAAAAVGLAVQAASS
jgi:hypothetical protein